MNTFLSRSLATKLVVVVGPLLALVVMAITWLAVTTASRSQKQSEARGLVQLTAAQAAKINSTNVDNLAVARQTSHGFGTLPKDDRGFVDGYLKGVFLDHRTSAGVYAQFEPNTFGGPGTYAPWWGLTDGKLTYVGQSVDISHADWYQVPKVTRRPSVIEPYVDPKIHVLMTSYTAPVFTGGRFRGVTGIDVALADVQRDVARLKVLQTGKAFLVTPKGTFLAAPRKSLVGKPAWPSLRDSKLASLRTAIRRARSSQTTAANPFGGGDAIITSSPVAVGGWSLVTIAPVSEALAPVTRLRNRLLIVGLLALLLTGAALLVTATRLLAPLRGFVTRLRTISERDVPAVASGLEAIARGDLSQTVQATAEPVPSRGLDEVATASDALNAVVESTRASADAYEQSRASLAEVIGQVAAASKVVSHSSQEVASSAAQANHVIDDIAGSISQVAESAGRQAAMVGSAQERAELVNRAIQVSAQGAQETAEAAQRAQQAATEGAARIDEATAAMAEARASSEDVSSVIESLAERSGRIGDIVRTITTITEQTNLLALNAAIEAARAGEQGRGFAVVADQVRDLAEESQRAAESISTLVDEIQAETQRTVTSVADDVTRTKRTAEIVTAARDAFESIADAVGDVTDRVHDIAETAAQVATQTAQVQEDMEEVAKLSDQSSAAAEQVSASAEQSSATTHEIAEAAVALARSAETLDGLVGRFSS